MRSISVHTVLYDDVEDQDYIGPITVLGVMEGVTHSYVTLDGPCTVTTASGARISVDRSWSPETADLILVPGGGYGEGSGVDRQVRAKALPQALATAQRPDLVLAAVCTGVLLLSAAGLTDGRPCTTHHVAYDDLRAQGGVVTKARVVDHGNLVTSGGVTSGIDLGLWLAERLFGQQAALLAEEVLEYERRGTVWRAG